jgi:hypothetical protein
VQSKEATKGDRRIWRPHWRVMTWVILVFNAIMLAWIIGGGVSASNATNCAGQQYVQACQTGSAIGTGIGEAMLVAIWLVGDLLLLVLWLVTKSRGRDCPVCGSNVKRGHTACRRCGHDFRAAATA